MRWHIVLALVAVLSSASACLDALKPAELLPGAVPFTPPESFDGWWANMETCSHLTADYGRVSWYYIPGGGFDCPTEGGNCDGMWQPPHTIYLAHERMNDSVLVEHEMLHDLIQRGDHPPVFDFCGVR